MLNKIIQQQLAKVQVDLSNHNEDGTEYIIKQVKEIRLAVDKYYIIMLDDVLLYNAEDSILTINWNHGNVPKSKYLKVEVNKVMGNMILATGIGYDYENNEDLNVLWSGWLPIPQIKVISEL